MTTLEGGAQRAPFLHGTDCQVEFTKYADNRGARADVFEITVSGEIFEFQMMKMRHKDEQHPWVFGSFKRNDQKKQLWSFKTDLRVRSMGFKGDVYTYVYDGETYALFVDNKNVLEYIVPFAQMLLDPDIDPDSDDYIAKYGDLYNEMRDIAQALNLTLPEDVLDALQRDTDDIEALV